MDEEQTNGGARFSHDLLKGSAAVDAANALRRILAARKEGRRAVYVSNQTGLGLARRSPYAELMIAVFALYTESEDWQEQRRKCLASTGGKCAKCGGEASVAHHENYAGWSCGDIELHSLVPLCGKCHSDAHAKPEMRELTPFFAKSGARQDMSWVDDDDLMRSIDGAGCAPS